MYERIKDAWVYFLGPPSTVIANSEQRTANSEKLSLTTTLCTLNTVKKKIEIFQDFDIFMFFRDFRHNPMDLLGM
jgi:hypothetical protein